MCVLKTLLLEQRGDQERISLYVSCGMPELALQDLQIRAFPNFHLKEPIPNLKISYIGFKG